MSPELTQKSLRFYLWTLDKWVTSILQKAEIADVQRKQVDVNIPLHRITESQNIRDWKGP